MAARSVRETAVGVLEEQTFLPKRHRVTVDDYYRMAAAGILTADDRVELIEGEVIDMAPIGSRHGSVVKRLIAALSAVVQHRAVIAVQDPLRLSERSEPQPDLMLLEPRDDFYRDAHPAAADVLLLIEVADSSAGYDHRIKLPLYARHGVGEVWIVDLDHGLVRFCRDPRGDTYADVTTTRTPGPTAVRALPGLMVDLRGVLS